MTDLEALTLTLYGEARGEPIEGLIGVAMVIRNRVRDKYRGAVNYEEVCLAPAQFSCWIEEKETLAHVAETLSNEGPSGPSAGGQGTLRAGNGEDRDQNFKAAMLGAGKFPTIESLFK